MITELPDDEPAVATPCQQQQTCLTKTTPDIPSTSELPVTRRGSSFRDKDESDATGVMSAAAILKVCKQHERDGMYRTPELNEVLYLHYKGYTKMGGLTEYTEVKVLWLEGNAFTSIEGLDHQQKLRTLYLQENCLESLEPLGRFDLPQLDTLNVSDNFLHKIEGLSTFPVLRVVHMKRNRLRHMDDLIHLLQCPSLAVIDVSSNHIDDPEVLSEIFAKLPKLAILHLEGNPVTRNIPHYRKTVIYQCQNLKHLDDRPVFEDERRMCNAWGVGGLEAEKVERVKIADEKEQKRLENMKAFDDIVAQARRRKSELDIRGEKEPPTLYYRINSLGERSWALNKAQHCDDNNNENDDDNDDGTADDNSSDNDNHATVPSCESSSTSTATTTTTTTVVAEGKCDGGLTESPGASSGDNNNNLVGCSFNDVLPQLDTQSENTTTMTASSSSSESQSPSAAVVDHIVS